MDSGGKWCIMAQKCAAKLSRCDVNCVYGVHSEYLL